MTHTQIQIGDDNTAKQGENESVMAEKQKRAVFTVYRSIHVIQQAHPIALLARSQRGCSLATLSSAATLSLPRDALAPL